MGHVRAVGLSMAGHFGSGSSRPHARRRPAGAPFWRRVLPDPRARILRLLASFALAIGDAAAILGASVLVEAAYHLSLYRKAGDLQAAAQAGAITASLFVGANLLRQAYDIEAALQWSKGLPRMLGVWTVSFLLALFIAFLSKATDDLSRGATVLFYVTGSVAVAGLRAGATALARSSRTLGAAFARRVVLVGFEPEIEVFRDRYETAASGTRIVAATVLRPVGDASERSTQLDEDLALARSTARFVRPDDVFILVPWSRTEVVDRCIEAFVNLPSSIHLGPEPVFERFHDARVSTVGSIPSLAVASRPLSAVEVAGKRLFDLCIAVPALVALMPFLAIVAVVIRLDSRGPALFTQVRYGFNQEPFRIHKFRSMHAMEDGAHVRQATRNDARVTRVGRVLRRWNLDELPQLINVVRGDMSLVGPRPHAMAHDQAFERQIARYARRHNVKPGITGWAQVNGLRGEILHEDQIRARVEHDLYYIDHWSPWLDLRILALTLVSPKSYRNAY